MCGARSLLILAGVERKRAEMQNAVRVAPHGQRRADKHKLLESQL